MEAKTDAIYVIPTPGQCRLSLRRLGKYGPMAFSGALHTGVLLVMAVSTLPATVPRRLELDAVFDAGQEKALEEFRAPENAAANFRVTWDPSQLIPENHNELPDFDIPLLEPALPAAAGRQTSAPPSRPSVAPTESPLAASSIEEAVARVTDKIEEKAQVGDVLVVWLLDASHSMADDRQLVAALFASYVQHLDGRASSRHELLNAVVSFGAATKELVAPTQNADIILSSVREPPVDVSGEENVFAAVEECVASYGRKWRDKQLMIVVWTDESGDDAPKLENTIRICRQHDAAISVVGPSAVLGADTGMYSFGDFQSPHVLQLPVRRGPDSAMRERLELGYWFLTQSPQTDFGMERGFGGRDVPSWYGDNDRSVPGYRCVAATESDLPSWYGGPDLKGLISGFSPYALTRLTEQTGGQYIILDRDGERGPFSADAMRAYLPDYRSAKEYLEDVHSHPLRRAVMEAVGATQNKNLGPPPTMLFGEECESPPKGFMRAYFTPAGFASALRRSRRRLKGTTGRARRIVEQALAHVSEPGGVEKGLESEYEKEASHRWRAWYDLTRGRLLAVSVRLEEYRLTCDLVVKPGFLSPTTNHLIFVPSMKMKSDSNYQRRAEEAERMLVRCIRENPHTPWAWLAQRELDYGLGIDVRQHAITLFVMPSSTAGRPRLPKL